MDNEQRFRLVSQSVDGAVAIARTGLWVLCVALIAAYTKDVLVAFAGKQTDVNLLFGIAAKLQADRWIAYLFGGGGLFYGFRQKQLRQRNIERLTKRPNELESRMDPGRTSSNLTPRGKTRSEDR